MLELEAAEKRILSFVRPLPPEPVALHQATGRVVATALTAPLNLPPFDNSAMDGYAVRAEDLAAARRDAPVRLAQVGRVPAGKVSPRPLRAGQCIRIFTGSPLPPGSNAVIMQEDTCAAGEDPGEILMRCSVEPGENVRRQGEDVQAGRPVLLAGERLSAAKLALLGALGVPELNVGRAPIVGLIATGSELREPPASLAPGQIYESNRLAISVLAAQAGAKPKVYPLVPDELSATETAIRTALEECDAVITTGGVSVGETDFVKAAWTRLGGSVDFWRVSIKPGKPFAFGQCNDKLVFGLPGNPVSAFVTFLLLVRPALLQMQGAAEFRLARRWGNLGAALANDGDRRHFVRVRVDADGTVRSSGPQSSHRLASLASANALIDVPPHTTLETDERVTALMWE